MTEEQELKLPEELKRLLGSKSELRNDIRDAVLNIIFKIAEKSAVYLNPVYMLNHILATKIEEGIEYFCATIFLDNGMVITATITPHRSYIMIDSVVRCECEEKGR